MTIRWSLWGVLGAGLVMLDTSAAWACGATPPPTFGLASPGQPDAGVPAEQVVARDAPFVVPLTCSYPDGTSPLIVAAGCSGSAPGPTDATFVVRPLSQLSSAQPPSVAGRVIARHDALIFVPSAPLEAGTSYSVEASIPGSTTASAPLLWARLVRASDALLPAFVSATAPSVVPEWYDAPVTKCDGQTFVGQAALQALQPSLCGPLGANCQADLSVRALRFHAKFGVLGGGATDLPYEAQLNVSVGAGSPLLETGSAPADAPGAGQLQNVTSVAATNGTATLYLDAIKPDPLSQKLCVRARAFDAAGKVITVPEQCATYVEWMTDAEWPDEAADRTANGAVVSHADAGLSPEAPRPDNSTSDSKSSDGCSTSTSAASHGAWAALVLCLATLLGRRKSSSR